MDIFYKKDIITAQSEAKMESCKFELTEKQRRYIPVKRALDIAICLPVCILLAPVMAGIAITIKLDSPGPVLFKQKRVGKDQSCFEIWKFRTMRVDTPKDTPTHMLKNPEQYITKAGRFMRLHSLDELPQLYQCLLTHSLSLCGPRPALWNQDDLVAERERYGANSMKPGITGWAQINGRDELEISDKARLDGEYVEHFGLGMDLKCLLGTIGSVLNHRGVVEGGTGVLRRPYKKTAAIGETDAEPELSEDEKRRPAFKRVLITGADSYIGLSVERWLKRSADPYEIETLDMTDEKWRNHDFSQYDVVYHVAGIAHADAGKATEEQKKRYYDVNRDLAVETAETAKKAGVRQFIFMSSMIVYSGCREKMITEKTVPNPSNFYGDSKWQADQKIRELSGETFRVVVVRPPMIYGKGSRGNYSELARLAARLPVFPIVKNKRSMLHIDNLCCFIKLMIDNEESGVFFPQNGEYTNTSDMVQIIAEVKGHRIWMIPFTNLPVKLLGRLPGKIGGLAAKAFGDSAYEMSMSEYKKDYRIHSLRESITLIET